MYHAIAGAEAHRPGLHRADDRGRGPVTDVTLDSGRDPDDRALVDRFLDMMAAEAGASRHTLAAYRNDLERAAEALADRSARRPTDDLSRLGAAWAELAPSTVARRSAALRRFFGFLVDDGLRERRSVGGAAAAAARTAAAANPRRGRDPAHVRGGRGPGRERRGAARSQPRAARIALRLGASRERAGQPAARRGARRPAVPDGARQGRQGAAGADLLARRGGGRNAGSTCRRASLWLFPERQEAFEPGAAVPDRPRDGRRTPEFRPSGSARTSFATPSRPTCCRAARTSACSSRCSAMPTSRRPRFTPMSTARGWSSWSTPAIRSRRAVVDGWAASSYPPPRMLTYLDFEKPIAELETRVAELKETASSSDDIDIDAEVGRLEAKSAKLLARHLRQADTVAEGAGRAASRAAALQGLSRRDRGRFRAAGRRPGLRRRPGDHRRAWPGSTAAG